MKRRADPAKVIDACKRAGLTVAAVRVLPDGAVEVLTMQAKRAADEADEWIRANDPRLTS